MIMKYLDKDFQQDINNWEREDVVEVRGVRWMCVIMYYFFVSKNRRGGQMRLFRKYV